MVNIPRQGPTAVFELKIAPIKEKLKPGRLEGTIRIRTNDPEFPELVIAVRAEIR